MCRTGSACGSSQSSGQWPWQASVVSSVCIVSTRLCVDLYQIGLAADRQLHSLCGLTGSCSVRVEIPRTGGRFADALEVTPRQSTNGLLPRLLASLSARLSSAASMRGVFVFVNRYNRHRRTRADTITERRKFVWTRGLDSPHIFQDVPPSFRRAPGCSASFAFASARSVRIDWFTWPAGSLMSSSARTSSPILATA